MEYLVWEPTFAIIFIYADIGEDTCSKQPMSKQVSQHQKLNNNIKSIITSEQFDTLLMFIPQAATVGVL